jgi:hypothetical protein
MSCILSIVGKELDVDGFIQKSGLEPYKTFYKGEPRLRTKPDGEKRAFSGLSIETSNADFNQLDVQISDTIAFLKANKEKLQHIVTTKEVDHATLDFGIELRIDYDRVVYQFDRFPAELLRLAGGLGIDLEISLYPASSEEE